MNNDKIWARREATEKWLDGQYLWSQFFVKTSEHPAWQGKVKCRYCKAKGWPQYEQDGNRNPKWWGHKHGRNCKWKELYDLKMRSQGNYYYNTISTSNTTWAAGGANITTAGTFYIKTP